MPTAHFRLAPFQALRPTHEPGNIEKLSTVRRKIERYFEIYPMQRAELLFPPTCKSKPKNHMRFRHQFRTTDLNVKLRLTRC